MRAAPLVATLGLAVAVPALGAGASIHVSPHRVHAGERVSISGSAGGCPAGDSVTLLSSAFSHRHEFAGVPAVYARVHSNGRYGRSTTIPHRRRPGRYSITARCGGGNLGVEAHLRVLS